MSWIRTLFPCFITKESTEEIDPSMKFLVVGLGNMGSDYDGTRHNVGFEVVDELAKSFNAKFEDDQLGDICHIKYKGRTIYLLKPSTYMNRSGKAVRYWVQKLKIQQSNLLVVVDDINLDFGVIRLRKKGKDGGHNGLRDINQLMGSQYARLRMGIGNDFHPGQQVRYVLGQWSKAEMKELPFFLDKACETIKQFTAIGIDRTMNLFNG